jgi:hypothetical protein
MTAELISRAEAKALGLKHYFTGKACPKGHVSKRTTHNTSCAECQREIRERIRRKLRGHRQRSLRGNCLALKGLPLPRDVPAPCSGRFS